MYPSVLCDLNFNSLKLSLAHYLEVGTFNFLVAFDPADSTSMGSTDKISMFGYSIERPSEINVLKDLVEEYNEIYGIALYPDNEDKFIIADFAFLCFNLGIKLLFKQAIPIQFTFKTLRTYL